MKSIPKTGRFIGALFLVQFVIGVLVNLFLLGPIIFADDFLISAAPQSDQIITAILLGSLLSIIGIATAILIFPIVKQQYEHAAYWCLAFCIAGFTAGMLDYTFVYAIVSLSQDYVDSGDQDASYFITLGNLLQETRGWTHLLDLLVSFFTLSGFYYLMYRSKLIPRFISVWGICASTLLLLNVLLMLYGSGSMQLFTPLALGQILTFCWLLVKGFSTNKLLAANQ